MNLPDTNMLRTRDWRIKTKIKKTIKRLKLKCYKYYSIYDINNNTMKYSNIIISDFLGTHDYFQSKTISTCKNITNHKVKYSPNKRKVNWTYNLKDKKFREKDKIELIKILKNI